MGHNHETRVTLECEACGNEFEVKKSRQKEARFCSNECRADWQSDAFRGENGPGWKGAKSEYECKWCETVFEQYDSQGGTIFCSQECYWEWFRENAPTGPDHHSWKDGAHYDYGEGWNLQKRKQVLERDDYQCQECRMSQEEHKDTLGNSLHVHHIVPYRIFDDNSEANRLENLVLLCAECHMEVEHQIWQLEDEQESVSHSEYRQILGQG